MPRELEAGLCSAWHVLSIDLLFKLISLAGFSLNWSCQSVTLLADPRIACFQHVRLILSYFQSLAAFFGGFSMCMWLLLIAKKVKSFRFSFMRLIRYVIWFYVRMPESWAQISRHLKDVFSSAQNQIIFSQHVFLLLRNDVLCFLL